MTQPTGIYSMEHNGLYVGRDVSATPSPLCCSPPGVCNLDPSVPGKSLRYPPDATLSLPSDSYSGYHTANLTITFARIAAISSPLMNAVADKRTEIRKPVPTPAKFRFAPWESRAVRPGFGNDCNDHVMTFFRDGCGELGVFGPSNVP